MADLTPLKSGTFIIFECSLASKNDGAMQICQTLERSGIRHETIHDEREVQEIIEVENVGALIIFPSGNRELCLKIVARARKINAKLSIMICDNYYNEDYHILVIEAGA